MENNFYNRGQTLTGILIVLVVVGIITGGLYFYLSSQVPETSEITEKQEEKKIIPSPEQELPEKETTIPEETTPKEEVVPVCQNECSQTSLKKCSGNGYQTCGNYDTDNCLEWSSIIACPINTICQNGICIQQTQQEQRCADGTLYGQCSTNKPQYCANGNLVNKCSLCSCSLNYYCDKSSELCRIAEKADMLIFLSSQYANDSQIKEAINIYIEAVKEDINWTTEIITLTSANNDFRKIDELIEDYYNKSGGKLKAAIMVGEDINTALGVEYFGEEAPSATPWATLEKYYMLRKNEGMSCVDQDCEITDNTTRKIIERFNLKNGRILDSGYLPDQLKRLDILISFLYPTHELNYETRSQQIRLAFEKFSKNRTKIYSKASVMFTDTAKERASQLLNQYGNAYYKEKPTTEELTSTLNGEYMLYFVAGHGTPSGAYPSEPDFSVVFGSEDLNSLNTPIFLASGCHTQSWWTNDNQNNGKLDFSVNKNWFGSKIFSNPYLKVEVLGIANQLDKDLRSFVEIALPDLMVGENLAESLIGKTLKIDNGVIYGDPTFHYNF